MTIEEAIVYGKKYISSTETKMLLSKVTVYDTLELIDHLHEELNEKNESDFKKLIQVRLNNYPVQYITNSVNFYGLELYVDESVLIPRFETEELVDYSIKLIKELFTEPKVLDLCCGSGAIGLSIKSKIPNAIVKLSDISKDALVVTQKNSNNLNLDVEVIESDLFNNINEKFDCIISNPPYIKTNEEIESIVKDNEPKIALYGGKDGLDYYRRILKDIKNYLNDKFIISFEIGETQKDNIIDIVNEYLENVEIISKKDMSERDRMIFIIKR